MPRDTHTDHDAEKADPHVAGPVPDEDLEDNPPPDPDPPPDTAPS